MSIRVYILFILLRSLQPALSFADEVDLGVLSVESGIRYPSTQIIEPSGALEKATRDVLTREVQRIEDELLEGLE